MQQNWSIFAITSLLVAAPVAVVAAPVTISVGTIESIGGEQNFCPSAALQESIVRTLSRNSDYKLETSHSQVSQTGVQLTGEANCSLGLRQRQRGLPLFQQRSIITTASVELQLQLVNLETGTTIATIVEAGKAEAETQSIGDLPAKASSRTDELFEQAIAQAVDAVLVQVNAVLR
jgi:hypothetical protein